jgi:hypothetical protein
MCNDSSAPDYVCLNHRAPTDPLTSNLPWTVTTLFSTRGSRPQGEASCPGTYRLSVMGVRLGTSESHCGRCPSFRLAWGCSKVRQCHAGQRADSLRVTPLTCGGFLEQRTEASQGLRTGRSWEGAAGQERPRAGLGVGRAEQGTTCANHKGAAQQTTASCSTAEAQSGR